MEHDRPFIIPTHDGTATTDTCACSLCRLTHKMAMLIIDHIVNECADEVMRMYSDEGGEG